MKIKTLRIENFRSFQDETIFLNRYACLVGPSQCAYAREGGLEKNGFFIADWLAVAYEKGMKSSSLARLCETIIEYSTRCNANA